MPGDPLQVFVTGASGKTGLQLIKELLQHKEQLSVKACVRSQQVRNAIPTTLNMSGKLNLYELMHCNHAEHASAPLQAKESLVAAGVDAANLHHLDLSSPQVTSDLATALTGCDALIVCTAAGGQSNSKRSRHRLHSNSSSRGTADSSQALVYGEL
jgi:dihydrodipicolinate reductase